MRLWITLNSFWLKTLERACRFNGRTEITKILSIFYNNITKLKIFKKYPVIISFVCILSNETRLTKYNYKNMDIKYNMYMQ